MTDKHIEIVMKDAVNDCKVGELWSHYTRGKESSDFEYSSEWLKSQKAFNISPELYLSNGKHSCTDKPIIGALSDCAPDTWGRMLMRRFERQKAKIENRAPKVLNEIDYLMLVNDFSRQGAIRLKEFGCNKFSFDSDIKSIPPLVDIKKLLDASNRFCENEEHEDDLKLLISPGSSLGGARPKASVIDEDENLCIAKFPKRTDEFCRVLWEALALTLAKNCGLKVQDFKVIYVGKTPVIILKRFDREKLKRIPFMSAMTMLKAVDNDSNLHSYLEIADGIRQNCVNVKADLKELFSRIIFSILISNTDDHLRNHGFLRLSDRGWSLSPLYDVNPNESPRDMLTTLVDEVSEAQDLEVALNTSEYYDLSFKEAKEIALFQKQQIQKFEIIAKELKICRSEIDTMSYAFRYALRC